MEAVYNGKLNPIWALIMYEGHESLYAETHPIINGEALAATPLKMETLKGISEIYYSSSGFSADGIIPDDVINFGRNWICWKTLPVQRKMIFKYMPIQSGTAWQPPLIWLYKERNLEIFAYKKWEGIKTKLYVAPFHNTDVLGKVCLGSTTFKYKSPLISKIIKAVEKGFYESAFTHGQNYKNLATLWSDLIKTKKKFPLDELKRTNQTIKSITT